MFTLMVLFFLLCLFVLAPVILIGLSSLFCEKAFSYKEGLILCLQLSGIAILFQAVQLAIISFLPPLFAILNIVLVIVVIIIVIAIIKRKFDTSISKAILIHVVNIVLAIAIAFSFRTFVCQAFKIPAGSNMPTILIGDHILANKFIYRFIDPKYGDFIIFKYPLNEKKDYIKRIIGTPGDQIEIINKTIYINGSELNEAYAVNLDSHIYPKKQNPRDNYGPFTVPENSFFVLGDNRDNSHDSRFFGAIHRDKIKGKADAIYFSIDNTTNQIRWQRIGEKIK